MHYSPFLKYDRQEDIAPSCVKESKETSRDITGTPKADQYPIRYCKYVGSRGIHYPEN